jgi:hypothetical protein
VSVRPLRSRPLCTNQFIADTSEWSLQNPCTFFVTPLRNLGEDSDETM